MPCFRPLKAYLSSELDRHGRPKLTFSAKNAYRDIPAKEVSCGQCLFCRMARRREWTARILHESSLYLNNHFITLTYRDECLPSDNSLVLEDWQEFTNRLRKHKPGFRYFHCGEYGGEGDRPHYHAAMFNLDIGGPDQLCVDKETHIISRKRGQLRYWRTSDTGHKLYRSDILESCWDKGFVEVGTITQDSAAYIAGYCTKKVTGQAAEARYGGRKPEYATMSKGIGRGWFEKNHADVVTHDRVILKGKEMRAPKYYVKRIETDLSDVYEEFHDRREIKNKEIQKARKNSDGPSLEMQEEFAEKTFNARGTLDYV